MVKGGAHKFVEEFVRMMKSKEIVAGMVRSVSLLTQGTGAFADLAWYSNRWQQSVLDSQLRH